MSKLQRANVPRCSSAELERLHAAKDWNALWLQALPLVGFTVKKLIRNGRLRADCVTDDLIQEANLAARKYVESWNPELGKFSTWLVNKLNGCLLDQIRRASSGMVGGRDAHGTTGFLNENADACVSDSTDPFDLLMAQELRSCVKRAVESLSAAEQAIICWCYSGESRTIAEFVNKNTHGIRTVISAKRLLSGARSILSLRLNSSR